MKNKVKFSVLAFFAILLLVSCKKIEITNSIDKDEIKAEIQSNENALAAAFNNRDPESINYYADNATIYHVNTPPVSGREAIKKFLKDEITSMPQGSKIVFVTKEVVVSNDGNQVVEIGSFILSDANKVKLSSGNYMSVFEKDDDKYLCVKDMNIMDPIETTSK